MLANIRRRWKRTYYRSTAYGRGDQIRGLRLLALRLGIIGNRGFGL